MKLEYIKLKNSRGQNMETALVTGGTGFVGSHLSCLLVRQGFKVFAISRSAKSHNKEFNSFVKEGKISVIQGDVRSLDINSLPEVNYIYHVAGKVAVWGAPEEFKAINIDGTKRVLEFAKQSKNLKCFCYFSSVAVYGFGGYKSLKEGAEFTPMKNCYPLSKIACEKLVINSAKENGFDYLIIRPGNVYGEYDYTSSYDIYKRVKAKKMLICGGGRFESCFVYVKNLVSAVAFLSQKKEARNSDYNLTDGNVLTLREVLDIVAEKFGVKNKFKNVSAFLSRRVAGFVEGWYKLWRIKKPPLITKFTVEQNLHDYSFSMEKTLSQGFEIPYSTETGIQNTVNWFNSLKEEKK